MKSHSLDFLPRPLTVLIALVILGTLLLYGNAVLNNNYAWDDWQLFINSPYLRNPSLVFEGLVRPIIPGTTYFRPLPLATFAGEFYFWGVDPVASHAVNLALHVLNTCLVGLVFLRLTGDAKEGTSKYRVVIAMALYAVHPALVEPVAWAAGRFDLMVTAFYLACIAVYLSLDGILRLVSIWVLYLFACFSKEMAATLPAVLMIIEFCRNSDLHSFAGIRRAFLKSPLPAALAALLSVGVVYLLAKYHFMSVLSHVDTEVSRSFRYGIISHAAFVGQTYLFYLRMVFWPFSDLSPFHPFDVKDLTVVSTFVGVLAIVGIAVAFYYSIAKRRFPGAFFGAGLISLLPVSNVIPLTIGGNIGHERFLTLPLAFFAMAIASTTLEGARLSPTMRRAAVPASIAFLAMWIALAALNVRITAPLWQNDLTLWKWAYEKNPNFYIANIEYAGAAVRYQEYDLAKKILTHAKTVDMEKGKNILPQFILESRLLLNDGRPKEAVQLLESALPQLAKELDKSPRAEKNLKVELSPQLQSVYYTALASAYNSLGDYQKASVNGDLAVSFGPLYSLAWFEKSMASYGLGGWSKGETEYAKALHYVVDAGADVIGARREKFLSDLCGTNAGSRNVCASFRAEENENPAEAIPLSKK